MCVDCVCLRCSQFEWDGVPCTVRWICFYPVHVHVCRAYARCVSTDCVHVCLGVCVCSVSGHSQAIYHMSSNHIMYSHIMYRLWMDATAQIVQSKAAPGILPTCMYTMCMFECTLLKKMYRSIFIVLKSRSHSNVHQIPWKHTHEMNVFKYCKNLGLCKHYKWTKNLDNDSQTMEYFTPFKFYFWIILYNIQNFPGEILICLDMLGIY